MLLDQLTHKVSSHCRRHRTGIEHIITQVSSVIDSAQYQIR
ncbi:Uncharacterised protein [Vibrio cholerae]|nr:Uncharacterised protein [Vibrio cholerae]